MSCRGCREIGTNIPLSFLKQKGLQNPGPVLQNTWSKLLSALPSAVTLGKIGLSMTTNCHSPWALTNKPIFCSSSYWGGWACEPVRLCSSPGHGTQMHCFGKLTQLAQLTNGNAQVPTKKLAFVGQDITLTLSEVSLYLSKPTGALLCACLRCPKSLTCCKMT